MPAFSSRAQTVPDITQTNQSSQENDVIFCQFLFGKQRWLYDCAGSWRVEQIWDGKFCSEFVGDECGIFWLWSPCDLSVDKNRRPMRVAWRAAVESNREKKQTWQGGRMWKHSMAGSTSCQHKLQIGGWEHDILQKLSCYHNTIFCNHEQWKIKLELF